MLWKIQSLGITSEDFINRQSENAPRAFYGSMWRFAEDQDFKKVKPAPPVPPEEPKAPVEPPPAEGLTGLPELSEEQLTKLPKEQLIEMASAVGVVKLDVPKAKLIEAILEKSR